MEFTGLRIHPWCFRGGVCPFMVFYSWCMRARPFGCHGASFSWRCTLKLHKMRFHGVFMGASALPWGFHRASMDCHAWYSYSRSASVCCKAFCGAFMALLHGKLLGLCIVLFRGGVYMCSRHGAFMEVNVCAFIGLSSCSFMVV